MLFVLALLAGFIAFRLYSVLGRRTGNERSRDDQLRMPDAAANPKARQGQCCPLPERSGFTGGLSGSGGALSRALLDSNFMIELSTPSILSPERALPMK